MEIKLITEEECLRVAKEFNGTGAMIFIVNEEDKGSISMANLTLPQVAKLIDSLGSFVQNEMDKRLESGPASEDSE